MKEKNIKKLLIEYVANYAKTFAPKNLNFLEEYRKISSKLISVMDDAEYRLDEFLQEKGYDKQTISSIICYFNSHTLRMLVTLFEYYDKN